MGDALDVSKINQLHLSQHSLLKHVCVNIFIHPANNGTNLEQHSTTPEVTSEMINPFISLTAPPTSSFNQTTDNNTNLGQGGMVCPPAPVSQLVISSVI